MKKKLLSVLLAFCMICSFLPATALAATPAGNAIKLELVKDTDTFPGKEVLRVDFMYKSGTDTPNNQIVYLKYDATKLYPASKKDASDCSSEAINYSVNKSITFTKNNYRLDDDNISELKLYTIIQSGLGYINWVVTEPEGTAAFADFTRISSIFFGLKDGVDFNKLPKDIIKLGTPAEDKGVTNQTLSIEFTVNGSEPLKYNSENAADNNLTVDLNNLFVAGAGVTFAEPAKPAYTGDIAAPTVKTNAGGKVELNDAVLTPADSTAKIQYGYSKTNDGKNITWQDSTTFNLTVGSTYYFYAKVVGTTEYTEKVSAASAAVTVADKALTSISISGDTTAAVPTKGSTTTVNLTATGKYDDSTTRDITAAAAWTVDPAYAGVSVSKGVVTIAPEAAAGSVTIKAEKDSKSNTHSITLSKASPALASMTISGADGVAVPPAASSPKKVTYTVSGEDQFGASCAPTTVTWSIDGTAPTGVSIGLADGKLSVPSTAETGSVTIKAVSGSTFATKTVSITKAAPAVDTVAIGGGVTTLNVPTVDALGTEKTVNAATAFTATLKDQYGALISGTVSWSVSGNPGVTIDSTSGLLTISSSATDADVTVTATAGNNKTDTASVTINKATSAATFVQVKKDGTVVTTDSIIIPASSSPATTVTYTAEVYDQYGALYTSDTPTWSITSATGVSVSAGTVSVDDTASAGTSVTLTATSSSDASKTAAVTITLSNKPVHNIGSFANSSVSITYGDAITGQTVGSSTGTVQYESSNDAIVSVDAAGTLTVHKAGNVTITAKVAEDTTHAAASTSYTVTVGKKQLEITGLTATDRKYDTTVNVALTGGTLSGKVGSDEVDASIPTSGTMTDAKVGNNKPVTVATPSLTGAAAGNYTLKPISGITVNIAQATPDVGNVSYGGGPIYTSTALSAITLSMDGSAVGTGTLKLDDGQTLIVGTNDYDWTFTPSDTTNYKTVTGKVSLTVEEDALQSIAASGTLSKSTYKWGEQFEIDGVTITATYASTATKDVTAEVKFSTTLAVGQTSVTVTYQGKTCDITGITVNKADALTGLADIPVSQKHTVTTEQSKDIGRADMPEDAGNLTYAKGSESNTGTVTIDSWSVDTTGKVTYKLSGGAVGATVTLPVIITSDNYENSTVNVVITLTDKDIPTVTAKDITVTYDGNAIPNSKITGTATFNGSTVEGAWSFKTTAPTAVADSNPSVAVVFTPNDATTYAAVETNIKVTINKATPTGTPTYTAITTSGKKLSDAALAIGSITPAGGSIAWDLGDTTDVTANTAYGWTYTPTDSANYNPLKGSITPYVVSYSGGGSYTPSYSITVDKTENGTITVSPKSASKGDTVTITVKPDNGYELDTLKVLDKNGDKVKLTEKNGKYIFTMPTGKVTVKGSFVEETPVQIFKDVPVDAYYYEAVKWAAEKGITGGVGNDLFAPNQPCTRAQIVTFLWRAAGSPAPKNMSSFADVPADAFYAKAVAWAVENGITGGTGDGKFSPDATCTRAQAVTFLYRASGAPAVSGNAAFSDVATNAYYAAAVKWAEKNGITGGIGGGLFGSDNNCTRAQIVTFLYRGVK